jgi:hypothetical protein
MVAAIRYDDPSAMAKAQSGTATSLCPDRLLAGECSISLSIASEDGAIAMMRSTRSVAWE